MAYANPEKMKHSSFVLTTEEYWLFKQALARRGQRMSDYMQSVVRKLLEEENLL